MGGALMTVGKARGAYGDSARNIGGGGAFDPSDFSVFSVQSGKSHQPWKATHHSTKTEIGFLVLATSYIDIILFTLQRGYRAPHRANPKPAALG